MAKILVIDDDSSISETLDLYLTEEGYTVFTALTGTAGLNSYVKNSPDVVILDIRLPDIDGFTVLEDLREEDENVKVIMITAHHDMESTIKAMKGGAFDYIHKPVNIEELDMAITKALKTQEMERKISGLLHEPSRSFKVGDIVGSHKEMKEIFKTVGVVSQSKTTVLIQGESGTGKELIAKVIHHNTSPDEPYIAVNCSAIVETLLESELFGHEKGSFTGAITRKLGKFELARYGTVFLDEISEMSINLQAKLLRVLQEKEFERVGGNQTIRVDVRFIAATNKNLPEMVKQGTFREDLYYRLNVFTIQLPPLRERKEDISLLADNLLSHMDPPVTLSAESRQMLTAYRWPGNVRELKNTIERAAVLTDTGEIEPQHLGLHINGDIPTHVSQNLETTAASIDERMAEIEKSLIIEALNRSGGVQVKAAEILGINQRSLWHRIKKLRVDVEALKNQQKM